MTDFSGCICRRELKSFIPTTMSLLQNEQEPVLHAWYHGYSPFLLGVKPTQAGEPPLGIQTSLSESNPVKVTSIFPWIGVAVFVLVIVVLLLAVV